MSDLPLQAATELEAVNFLLISIGEQPVSSLDGAGVPEVSIAQQILHQVSREVQSLGLICNTEESYPFPTDSQGNIVVPRNVLKIDASEGTDVVLRGNRLYNRQEHTYVFEDTLECDVVLFLEFTELPPVVRNYIMIRAARIYQSKVVGSQTLYQFSMKDEMDAYATLVTEQVDVGDYNMLQNPDVMAMNRRT
jgi:hypothetical protein